MKKILIERETLELLIGYAEAYCLTVEELCEEPGFEEQVPERPRRLRQAVDTARAAIKRARK